MRAHVALDRQLEPRPRNLFALLGLDQVGGARLDEIAVVGKDDARDEDGVLLGSAASPR